jgi:conjugal transfer pilus assembly protein TraW
MIKKSLIFFNFLFFLFSNFCFAEIKDLGSFGQSYKIKEKDALEEIYSQAQKVDFKNKYKKAREKAVSEYQPKNMIFLPETQKEKIFTSKLMYTLDFDIPDQFGNIIYPKGYTYNVLDYINMQEKVVVFDITKPKHLKWIKENSFLEETNVIFIASNGKAKDLIDFIAENYRKIYFCTQDVVDVFKVKTVPSIITQEQNHFKIHSINLDKNNEKN